MSTLSYTPMFASPVHIRLVPWNAEAVLTSMPVLVGAMNVSMAISPEQVRSVDWAVTDYIGN